MKFKIFIVLATLILQSYALDERTKIEIDNIIEDFLMPNNRIPGVSLSIVQNGQVEMAKGYGFKNLFTGLETDGNTLFAIGSITKSVVATLVVKTLNEMYPELGESALDIPLADLLPTTANFTLIDRYRAEQTSFRDLLSHRVCIQNPEIDLVLGTLANATEYAYRSRFLPAVCQFRNGYVYNNPMLSLAGELVAEIAESTLPQMMKNFWTQLGMINTTYVDEGGRYENLTDMSRPYVIRNGTLVEYDMALIRRVHMALGAGGILSSANDMAKYMNFHLNLGRVNNTQIIPEEVMEWLYRTSNPYSFQGGRTKEQDSTVTGDLGIAQGFMLALYDGWTFIHHGGYWPPFHCEMRLFPAANIGIYICANGPGVIMHYPQLHVTSFAIFDLILGNSSTNANTVLENKKTLDKKPLAEFEWGKHKVTKTATVPKSKKVRHEVRNEELLGIYGSAVDGDVIVSFEAGTDNETLQINIGEFGIGRLHPINGFPTTFGIEWTTSIMDHFFTYGEWVPEFYADFGIVDTFLLRGGTFEIYSEFPFERNATLDTFPPIPWTPDSCGRRVAYMK